MIRWVIITHDILRMIQRVWVQINFISCLFSFLPFYFILRNSHGSLHFHIYSDSSIHTFRSNVISFINCPIKAKHMPNEANRAALVLCVEAKKEIYPFGNENVKHYIWTITNARATLKIDGWYQSAKQHARERAENHLELNWINKKFTLYFGWNHNDFQYQYVKIEMGARA